MYWSKDGLASPCAEKNVRRRCEPPILKMVQNTEKSFLKKVHVAEEVQYCFKNARFEELFSYPELSCTWNLSPLRTAENCSFRAKNRRRGLVARPKRAVCKASPSC